MNPLKAVILLQSVLFQLQVRESPIQTGLSTGEFMSLITGKNQGIGLVSGVVWFRGSGDFTIEDLISLSISVLFSSSLVPFSNRHFPCGHKRAAAAPAITSSLLRAQMRKHPRIPPKVLFHPQVLMGPCALPWSNHHGQAKAEHSHWLKFRLRKRWLPREKLSILQEGWGCWFAQCWLALLMELPGPTTWHVVTINTCYFHDPIPTENTVWACHGSPPELH